MIFRRWCFNALFTALLAVSVFSFAQSSREQRLLTGLDLQAGRALFEKNWISAPASLDASDGLGPLYNARSCATCHASNVSPPDNTVVRLEPASNYYGRQLQTQAVAGLAAEVQLEYEVRGNKPFPVTGFYESLNTPQWRLSQWSAGEPDQDTLLSVRIAPELAGVGKLAQIPEAAILEREDPADADGDGISGRAVWITDKRDGRQLGRFGWQSQTATLREQIALALRLDMGIGNPLYPDPYGDCTAAQLDCRGYAHGNSAARDGLEADETVLDLLTAFVSAIPGPVSGQLLESGRDLFFQAGCESCHRATYASGEATLEPFTDLLLHDLGPGLADRRLDGKTADTEWRTTPLWGLRNKVAGTAVYLHDGRAHSLTEAILWHDGEARSAVERYRSMTEPEQDALITFLGRL